MSENKVSTESYKGVRDFYPSDWAKLSAVFEQSREVLRARGYEEYQASPLEHSELYESKGNEEIINEQTFTFEDRGGRRVTLRPEMTPTLARMVSAKRRELTFPLRWFSIGNRFRYERPQKGRLREFFQTDVDLIGLPEGEADIEIVTLASDIITSFGAKSTDFAIRLNSRKLIRLASEAVGLTEGETARAYWQLIDRKAKISKEEYETALKEFPGNPLEEIEKATEGPVADEKKKVLMLVEELKKRGVSNVSFDTDIVRGFDYYTGIVFEVNDTNPENPRALFGGGRYDGLVSLFGGEPLPAVGFAFGDVTMLDFLQTHNLMPAVTTAPELYIGTVSSEDIIEAQRYAEKLREKGVRTFVNLTDKKMGDQIRDAVRRSIPFFTAFGKDEAKTKKVRVKELSSGKEKKVSLKEIAKVIKKA